MRGDFLKSFATGFAMLGIILLALSGGTILGKYYTRVLQGWEINPDRQAGTGAKAVTAVKEGRRLKMNPVAFYFVQTGVFSDRAGAEAGAAELVKAGLKPYIGQQAPFRVFVGVFGDRDSAVKYQGDLREQGAGGFIQTLVLNNREISLNTDSKRTAEDLQLLLEDYTSWFQDNAILWRQTSVTDGDQKDFTVRLEKVIKTFHRLPGHLGGQIPDQGFREKLEQLYKSTGQYIGQLEKLKKSGTEADFREAQRQFTNVIENYSSFIRQIDNLSKT
jgi:hypothetical protein